MTTNAVKEAVKESLVGTEEPVAQLSAQTRLRFTNNAVKDPETGELYMGPDEFIKAVAPSDEDYVSRDAAGTWPRASTNPHRAPAQNQEGAVLDPFSRRR